MFSFFDLLSVNAIELKKQRSTSPLFVTARAWESDVRFGFYLSSFKLLTLGFFVNQQHINRGTKNSQLRATKNDTPLTDHSKKATKFVGTSTVDCRA